MTTALKTRIKLNKKKFKQYVAAKEDKILFQFGGYTRQGIVWSIRPAGKKNAVSKPGDPPRWHQKKFKHGFEFDVDMTTKSVSIGSVRFQTPRTKSNQTVPNALEFGVDSTPGGTRSLSAAWKRFGDPGSDRIGDAAAMFMKKGHGPISASLSIPRWKTITL